MLDASIFVETDSKEKAQIRAVEIAAALLKKGWSEQQVREELFRWNKLLWAVKPQAELEQADIRRIVRRAATYKRRASR